MNLEQESDVSKLLSKPESITAKLAAIIAFCLIVFLFVWLGESCNWDYTQVGAILQKNAAFLGINVALSIAVNMISSLFVLRALRYVEQSRIDQIREIGPSGPREGEGLIAQVLDDLKHYQGNYRKNQVTRITFELSSRTWNGETTQILLCHFHHSYVRISPRQSFNVVFYRIFTDADAKKVPDVSDLALDYDFIWVGDESSCRELFKPDDFRVDSLAINEAHTHTKLAPILMSNNSIIRYFVEQVAGRGTECRLDYRITVPLEYESCVWPMLEVPTYGCAFEFDLSGLPADVSAVVNERMRIRSSPIPNHHDKSIKFSIPGWLLPKEGVVMSWWKT